MSPRTLTRRAALGSIALALFVLPSDAVADQVFFDDLIVSGRTCAGFDCVEGMDLSLSSFVARENNTRILFDDTSTSAAFPNVDWTLVANDSSNGGRNRFSIENTSAARESLTVGANAKEYGLYLDALGVGFGTNAPAADVHAVTSDTPVLRLEQDGSVGWTPYRWDLGANESNFFVRDATANTLPIRVLPGAPDDALVVTETGEVLTGGTLSQGSSQAIKRDIQSIDPHEVLGRLRDLPIAEWSYRSDAARSTHLGPMAEDFYSTFGFGADAAHIAASDVAGVATAAAQALSQIVDEQSERIDELERQNAELSSRLDRIEQLLLEQR